MPSGRKNPPPSRLDRLRRAVNHPVLLTGLHDIRYVSGFTGSFALVLVKQDRAWLVTDRRYAEQSVQEAADGFEVVFLRKNAAATLKPLLKGEGRLDIDDSLSLARFRGLEEGLDGVGLHPVPSPVAPLRAVKDHAETGKIEAALRLTEEVMVYAAGILKPGMKEREVAAYMERYARLKGADGTSFPTIVASGPRSSLPHGEAGDRVIGKNEPVLLDFGFIMDGYCSDFTRVLYTGKKLPARIARVWSLVREAQMIGFEAVREGDPLSRPDARVRDFFRSNRVLSRYEHSLGHGVGLEIHEEPRLSEKAEGVMRAGMVVTVEPGLYYPGRFGIRLEDMVVVTRRGAKRLTDFPLEIACLG